MSTMFGGGGGASPASWQLTSDILKKNQAEQDRLTKEAQDIEAMAGVTQTSAKSLADQAEQVRMLGIKNPNPADDDRLHRRRQLWRRPHAGLTLPAGDLIWHARPRTPLPPRHRNR